MSPKRSLLLKSFGQPFYATGQSGQALKMRAKELKRCLSIALNTAGSLAESAPFRGAWEADVESSKALPLDKFFLACMQRYRS